MFPKWERWSLLSTKIKGFSNVGDIIQKSQILLPIPFFNPTPVIIQQIIFFKIFCQFPGTLGVRKGVSIDALMPYLGCTIYGTLAGYYIEISIIIICIIAFFTFF